MSSPPASSYNALRTMQANRRESGIERMLRRRLWAAGVRGYRLRVRLPGRPDLVFPGARLAVFVHGCYWHGCATCRLPAPKAHADFWREKFRQNQDRDRRSVQALRDAGWLVETVWEHELRNDVNVTVDRIAASVRGLRGAAPRRAAGHRAELRTVVE